MALLIAVAAVWSLFHGLVQGAYPGDKSLILRELDLVIVGPTLATNLLSTGLITWKAWCALFLRLTPDDYL
jgi:hypothetical protein